GSGAHGDADADADGISVGAARADGACKMCRVSIVLVAVAVGLRLAWVLLVPTRPVGDFAMYLEAAAHLVEHGALDDEFIYMPGYVFLVAGVQALGGGLLAAKLIGVAAGGLGAWAVFHIADRLGGRATAVVAGLLFALWPAGVAVASVTGTDMPAAALLATAVAVLLRGQARGRPVRAAVGFGVWLGLAAYVRAVALPLALLALPFWIAASPGRAGLRAALARTAIGCGVALLLLLPWGVRNRLRHGEFFLTDSHGGHTALVGANPNSEGVYSRSLNQMFWLGTGYKLFDPSPRAADRAAYALARSWAAFEPAYALGLVVAKADRLLTHERPLLYWPLYRESVLADPPRGFFDRHRAGVERLVDGFWYLLAAAALAGVALAALARQWRALAMLLFPLALVALYATFFSEVRYHLAIAIFLFPLAASALVWLSASARALAATLTPADRTRLTHQTLAVTLAVATLFGGWQALLRAGSALRLRHRWAVCVCHVDGKTRLCNWRATLAPDGGPSPLRGVWDGVGLRAVAPIVAADSEIELAPGRYRITARADRTPARATGFHLDVGAGGQTIAHLGWDREPSDPSAVIDTKVSHPGGKMRLAIRVTADAPPNAARRLDAAADAVAAPAGPGVDPATIWISDIRVEPDLR
ncbi:MAG TPA: glycosyltransferase family 39 protein, partial [Polyangia bacterium]|nr:glycosyltransferase family 39 protein [Polyangia bacterium]